MNRTLKLSSIECVGFDMDYTLAVYDQAQMDSLSVQLTIERLIRRGYPRYLEGLRYDYRFPIRGLLVDKKRGNILKMNRFKVVRKGYHGTRPLTKTERRDLYNHRQVRPHLPRYHWIDTLFSLSEVTSYAAIIDALEQHGERVDFERLFADVRASIDECHRDGTVYREVLGDLPRFIRRDPGLGQTLHKFRSAGKRLFLLTNSPWSYTDPVMSFVLGDQLGEYPSWRHFFDVVVAQAQKPTWFREKAPLLELNGTRTRPVSSPLERGRIYQGGHLADFENRLGVEGSAILYVGDHIYGDMVRSKKDSAWRTALIIPELDGELEAQEQSRQDTSRQMELDELRANFEDELRYFQSRTKALARSANASESERRRTKRAIERIRGGLRAVQLEQQALRDRVDERFHPYWGSLLKEQHEMSIFGHQVETYADVYMRRVTSLAHYSPVQVFRSAYDLMAHEL